MNLLFICHYNKMRSRTAETIYAEGGKCCALSAGLSPGAKSKVSEELIQWADLVFVMEEKHEQHIRALFPEATRNRKIIVLDIGDNYYYMDPRLVELIRNKVDPYLEIK